MEIVPFKSVGNLTFGDSRDAARGKLGSVFSTFRKVTGADETDAFDGFGLHLYYDHLGRLEFVEAFDPADVTFRGIKFLGRDLDAVIGDMTELGFNAAELDVGIIFSDAGMALTESSGVVEGISAYRKGYYD